jgi:spoIIIJ-associated protein
VAHEVAEHGHAKALEPMSSADRKAVHDAISEVDGVASRSEGDEPNRRVVISPA